MLETKPQDKLFVPDFESFTATFSNVRGITSGRISAGIAILIREKCFNLQRW